MLSINTYENADAVVIKLLKYLKLDISPKKVIDEFDRHPDHPSLLSISDVLHNFGIDNSAFRVDEPQLKDISSPFIAHTNRNNDFVVVEAVDDENVTVSDHLKSKRVLSRQEFREIFNGVVLTVNKDEQPTVENDQPAKSSSQLFETIVWIFASALFVSVIAFNITSVINLGWQNLLLILLQTTGLAVAILLLIQSLDADNPLVNRLCKGVSESFNCNEILSSKAAKVFDGLSWSEVGFFYFAGTTLLLLAGPVSAIQLFTLLNLIALPFTVYSFYYQGVVAKKWCLLCCITQAILLIEGLILNIHLQLNFNSLANAGPAKWTLMLMYLLLPTMAWLLLKPLFMKLKQLKPLQKQLKTFKYNSDLFNSLLHSQKQYQAPDESWSIVLGNKQAENVITMVTNPYCPPCTKTHNVLDEWLATNADIQVRIVFTAKNTDEDIKTPVTRHLMALNELPDGNKLKHALHDWYSQKQKKYDAWASVHPVHLDESQFYKIDKQNQWCEMAEISATPTLLINGYRLPKGYQVEDIKYLLA